jgi:hypothetical protein
MTRKCKCCKAPFIPARPLQAVCSPTCALVISREKTAKVVQQQAQAERKATREKLDALRTKPQLVKLAQTAFNAFIRARDAGKPCICCGKPLGTEPNTFDAGHYRSVGSSPHMRFVEDNVHGQAKHCNNYLGGNHVAYRAGLIGRIGLAAVERIESDQVLRKYTHEGLLEIAKHFRSEAKKLKEQR